MKIKYFFFKFSWKIFSFKLFPSSKIDFWPYLKWQKMDFGQKIFREINLFDFTVFFGLDFFLIFWHTELYNHMIDIIF